MMLKIRTVENKLANMRKSGLIGGPVHLGAGQEAVAVGISKHLRKSDRIFSGHRSHAHLLALGTEPRKLFAEVLGKQSGLNKGMGGSMHLWDGPNGFYGSVPIVAGTVPLAVGAALASKLQGKGDISVAYFGDGAIEEGVVHESLNLARQLQVPILFVCENNLFSSHMHISQRQPLTSVARFALANDIQCEVIDGNNIVSVEESAGKMIDIARTKHLPVFIEAFTYRHYGHVDWREDIDVGVNRSPEDLNLWKSRDPIDRLETA
ncbi:MAG: thiamine pyrophosphate-dependent dehydrogenase E1 component subunit alpha, partial [Polynucleobacter sp.]|nr:thiamine pyrophosphate-dependent dehydrogenase E1 component subunit alpha [Polynucleobacter sp.]